MSLLVRSELEPQMGHQLSRNISRANLPPRERISVKLCGKITRAQMTLKGKQPINISEIE